MAFIYGDPNTAGPFSTFQIKQEEIIAVKLTFADFTTGPASRKVAMLPADVSIVSMSYWNKTKLAGNSITTATLSVGTSSAGTQFVNAQDVFTTVGTRIALSPIAGILQPYAIPLGGEIAIYATGTVDANPTSGEIYLIISFVR